MMISKYSASGNDFVIFHAFEKKERNALAKELCHRQEGIGADGLIVLVPHSELGFDEKLDFEWEFYNADGSYAAMCGNGSRAAAQYAYSNGLAKEKMRFLTGAGVIQAEIDSKNHSAKKAQVLSELTPPIVIDTTIVHNNKTWHLIDTGVPHLVTFDADIEHFDIEEARELRYKYNCNVNIAKVEDARHMRVRTYERGVEDETLACGTGMAACYFRARSEGKVEPDVTVHVRPTSGELLYLGYKNETITFKGEVRRTFETVWEGAY